MADLNLDELRNKTAAARSALVLLPPEPEAESVAAAMALHQALKQSGKASILGCSTGVEGYDEIKTAVGKQNLIISFPYREEAIENVSYDIDEANNRFNLIIRPKAGGQPLDMNQVSHNYTGAKADIVFVFGITSLEELGKLYSDEKQFLDRATLVVVKKGGQPAEFAAFDLSAIRVLSLAELLVWLLRTTELKLPVESASSLYRQLVQSSNNFQSPLITPETFEAAAYLLRAGARTFPTPPAMPQASTPATLPPAPFFPTTPATRPVPSPKEEIPQETEVSPKAPVPADWQKPKIYRGSELG